jgi:hypothetical protein
MNGSGVFPTPPNRPSILLGRAYFIIYINDLTSLKARLSDLCADSARPLPIQHFSATRAFMGRVRTLAARERY